MITENKPYDRGMYVIDQDYRILYCNQVTKDLYPEIKIGDFCYHALAVADTPCGHCPIGKGESLFYNPTRREWIAAQSAKIELPQHGDCFNIQFHLKQRIAHANEPLLNHESFDEHIAELSTSTKAECVIGGYCEEGFPLFYANDRMVELLGYESMDEMIAGIDGLVINTIHPDDRAQVEEDLGDDYYPGMTYETVYRMPRKDGSWLWTVDKGKVIETESGRLAIISICTDRTTWLERQEEQLAEAMRQIEAVSNAKTAFLFNMSHDIRTPMNAIRGYTHILEQSLDDKEASRGALDKIKQSSDVLLQLLNNVLELSRIESGKEELNLAVVDLDAFSHKMHEMFLQETERAGIDFQLESDIQHASVWCDEPKLTRIIINMLSNALKFTEPGGRITFGVKQHPEPEETKAAYRFFVKDTGIGMSEEFQERAFTEFERERTSTESGVQGTGLGLPIIKRLTDLMGGTCSLKSELGEGTEVAVTIPFALAENTGADDEGNPCESVDLSNKRVLLVEDNELNREIARYMLEDIGVAVTEAENGAVAVEELLDAAPNTYDLVLMDIQMPVMDGYAATKVIRNLNDPTLAAIPIIAITANAFHEDRIKCLEAGMNAHVSKPINIRVLEQELCKALQA